MIILVQAVDGGAVCVALSNQHRYCMVNILSSQVQILLCTLKVTNPLNNSTKKRLVTNMLLIIIAEWLAFIWSYKYNKINVNFSPFVLYQVQELFHYEAEVTKGLVMGVGMVSDPWWYQLAHLFKVRRYVVVHCTCLIDIPLFINLIVK